MNRMTWIKSMSQFQYRYMIALLAGNKKQGNYHQHKTEQ